MIGKSSEIRAMARDSLKGNWGLSVVVFLIAEVIVFLASWIAGFVPVVGWLGSLLVSGPLTAGLSYFGLRLVRERQATFDDLWIGFQRFVVFFLLALLIAIFTTLWTLLLIIPGVIAALRYSMAYFIALDNPEIGAMDAIRRSKEMTDGYKWGFFKLCLSFIGWVIVCVLTFGIAALWVTPYFYTAWAHFYNELRQSAHTSAATDPTVSA